MKKTIILAATAIALCGCAKIQEDVVMKEIAFDAAAYKSVGTKSIIQNAYYGYDCPDFRVYITHIKDNGTWTNDRKSLSQEYAEVVCTPFDKEGWGAGTLEEKDMIWVGKPTAYWPLSGSLTFVGVTPASATSSFGIDTDGNAKLNVTNFDITKQDDLMYSYATDAMNLTGNTSTYNPENDKKGSTGVPIVFRHALSQIVVTVKAADGLDEDIKFDVSSIQFKDSKTGSLTVDENDEHLAAQPKWILSNTEFSETELISEQQTITCNTQAYTTNGVLAFPNIGETRSTKDSNVDPVLVVTYKQWQRKKAGEDSWADAGEKTVTIDLLNMTTPDAITSFVAGAKYVLHLTLSANQIKYSPSVIDWAEPVVEQDYQIPSNN